MSKKNKEILDVFLRHAADISLIISPGDKRTRPLLPTQYNDVFDTEEHVGLTVTVVLP